MFHEQVGMKHPNINNKNNENTAQHIQKLIRSKLCHSLCLLLLQYQKKKKKNNTCQTVIKWTRVRLQDATATRSLYYVIFIASSPNRFDAAVNRIHRSVLLQFQNTRLNANKL